MRDITLYVPLAAVEDYRAASVWKDFGTIAVAQDAGGTCGENLSWTLLDGTLTVIGTGNMPDYSASDPAPWSNYSASIETALIEEGVTGIGSRAFYGCTQISSVINRKPAPQIIASDAFGNVPVGNAVLYVPAGSVEAFKEASVWQDFGAVTVEPDDYGTCGENLTWTLLDGTLTVSGTGDMYDYTTSPWRISTTPVRTVIIEDGVTSIGDRAFQSCSSLSSVTIGNSVTSIGSYAFQSCSNLISVTNLNPTPQEITIEVFNQVTLSNVRLYVPAGSVEAYGAAPVWRVFQMITAVRNGMCGENLTWAISGNTLTVSGTGAMTDYSSSGAPWYNYHNSIETVIFNEGMTGIGNYAFENCSALTSITIPNSVTSIGNLAFYNCSGLTSVTIPDRVTSIGENAFDNCTGLTSVDFNASNCTVMGSSTYPVFSRCNALTTLNIGSEVQMIPAFAFSYCIGLTEITIPESVTGIGNSAFAYCIGLTKVTNLNPAPQAINAGVFESVAMGDASLYVPAESVKAYKAADVWKDFRTVTAIGAESGTCGANLTWMLLNRTLTISGTGAMSDYYASNAPWYVYRDSIETAVIEDGVTSIGSYAFSWCSSLASVTIGESVTHIGNFAFRYCMSLTAIDVHEYNAVYASENGVLFNKAKTTLILYPEGKPEVSYTISNGVASIESAAFISCSSLASVTIPESVTGIGEYPFIYCNSLTAINVSTNNAVYASENGVLFNKAKTSLLQYPAGKPEINYTIPNGVTGIGMRAFDSCHNLSSVMIGESVTNIGDHAFYNCSSLTSVTISESVTNIGEYAFGWCSSLASVEIPNNVEIIGNSAFISCRSLASVTIGESVTNIGYNAFAWCSSLASVTIGESVTSIGELAFYDCYNLTSVTNLSPTPQVINSNVFENISIGKITTLYVPAESVEAYKAADVWKDFKMITEYVPSAINAPTSANAIRVYPNPATESFRIAGLTTPTPVTVTNVNGQTVLQQTVTSDESISVGHLPQGVYFVRVNGKTVKVIKSF